MKKTCNKCPLAIYNDFKMVLPRGDIRSKLFIVGEAPGYKERQEGYVFVGKSGQLLQSFINAYSLSKFCYLTNAIKCRPPKNRSPYPNELNACRQHFIEEMIEGRPKIIVLLGNTAINQYFGKEINNITKLNNKIYVRKDGIILFGFHPSYILRNSDLELEYHIMFRKIKTLYRYFVNPYLL